MKGAQKAAWKIVPGHPQNQPAGEATLLWFRELSRTSDTGQRSDDYRARLAEAEGATDKLQLLLRPSAIDIVEAEKAFNKVSQSCIACHKQHRN